MYNNIVYFQQRSQLTLKQQCLNTIGIYYWKGDGPWSFLVLPLLSILISATCNLFSSFFVTAQHSAPYALLA